ncbi:hypothetical protein EDB83DRAFT_1036493 [Lactarius deliciosus]|nr:hypothetical protein EDB83DRAFT_1036493 [Lactarius deliciosus]
MDSERRSQTLLPIACRFVASDQWLTTQIDASLKISEVKRYLLTKVYNTGSTPKDYLLSRDRPVSPITFASSLPTPNSFDNSTEGSHEDDRSADSEFRLSEVTRQPHGLQAPIQRIASPTITEESVEPVSRTAMLPPHHYQMLAFSTGQLLEDDYSLAWYGLRPHELLELHPPGTMVRLPREIMLEYIQPYLELDLRALRVVVNSKDAQGTSHLQDMSPNKIRKPKDLSSESRGPSGGAGGPGAPPSIRKRRKMKLEWRDRYLVIRQGMLSLFKSRSDLTPIHTCLLSSLTTLRGQEDDIVQTATAALPSPHIVCAKFRVEVSTPNVHDSQLSSSPTTEQWCEPWSGGSLPRDNDGEVCGRRDSKESIKQRRGSIEEDKPRASSIPREDQHEHRTPEQKNESLWDEINAGDGTQGIWLILDTLNEFALSHLLRVLHRFCPNTVSSTLIPRYLLPDPSLHSSPSSPSSPISGTPQRPPYPYPEWRIEVSQRAQKAGLGDVSEAMGWILWGGLPEEPPAPKPSDPELRKKGSSLQTENPDTVPDLDADDDDGDYELEWDCWPMDLVRQARSGMDKHIAITPEPPSAHTLQPHERFSLARSTSNVSLSVKLAPAPPTVRHELLSSANMDLLSVDSPALLTAPSVLPFHSSGVTTSTVSVGGVVRTRSLMAVDGGRGRGVARAMEVPTDLGGKLRSLGKKRVVKPKRTREDYSASASATSSTSTQSSGFSPTSTVRSTVSAREGRVPSPKQSLVSFTATPGGGRETASMPVTGATSATTIQPVSRRSSAAAEQHPVAGDRAGRTKGLWSPSRGRAFSPGRPASKRDPASDFATG